MTESEIQAAFATAGFCGVEAESGVVYARVTPQSPEFRAEETESGWRLLLPIGYILVIAQRGHVYWLPYLPIFALTSVMLFAYLAWWLFAMRLAWRLRAAEAAPPA